MNANTETLFTEDMKTLARDLMESGVYWGGVTRYSKCCVSSCSGSGVYRIYDLCENCYIRSLYDMERELGTTSDTLADYVGLDTWEELPPATRETLVEKFLEYQSGYVVTVKEWILSL
jgi:hypothetical protein